jgi:hypothetical protein
MTEEETTPVQEQTSVEVKKTSVDLIKEAGDLGGVLTAYHELLKDPQVDRVSLQLTTAEQLNKLNKPEESLQFTILAEQTRNTERFGKMVEVMGGNTVDFGRGINRMTEGTESLGRSSTRILDAAQTIQASAGRMNRTER